MAHYYKIKIEDYPVAYCTTAFCTYPWVDFKKEQRISFNMELRNSISGSNINVYVPHPKCLNDSSSMIKVEPFPILNPGETIKHPFSMILAGENKEGKFIYLNNYESNMEITFMDLKSMLNEMKNLSKDEYTLMTDFRITVLEGELKNGLNSLNYEEWKTLIGDLLEHRLVNKFYLSLLKADGEFAKYKDEAKKYIINFFSDEDLLDLMKEGYFPKCPTDSYLGKYRYQYCLDNSIRILSDRYILKKPQDSKFYDEYLDLYRKTFYLTYPDHDIKVRYFYEYLVEIKENRKIEWRKDRYDSYYAEWKWGENHDDELLNYLLKLLVEGDPFGLFIVSYFELEKYKENTGTFFENAQRMVYFLALKDYADNNDDYMALYGVARCYATGRADVKSDELAMKYYQKANEVAPFDIEKVFGYVLFED